MWPRGPESLDALPWLYLAAAASSSMAQLLGVLFLLQGSSQMPLPLNLLVQNKLL